MSNMLAPERQAKLDDQLLAFGQLPKWWLALLDHEKVNEGVLKLAIAICVSRYQKKSTIRRTRKAWADLFGVHPTTITRWFAVLEDVGVIEPGKGKDRKHHQADERFVRMAPPADLDLSRKWREFLIGKERDGY